MTNCKNIQGDLKKIEVWAQIFKHPKALVSAITKNMLAHYTQVFGDISKVSTDWTAASYYQAGDDVADILTLTIGTVSMADIEESLY